MLNDTQREGPSGNTTGGPLPCIVRGALFNRADERAERGLIPACAGNMLKNSHTRRLSSAHPRSRGEHAFFATESPAGRGSSPLARGTHLPQAQCPHLLRLIPAHVGNTQKHGALGCDCRAHPRSRGEHSAVARMHNNLGGSSPLARGTQVIQLMQSLLNGLIPARAGNTSG